MRTALRGSDMRATYSTYDLLTSGVVPPWRQVEI